LAQLFSDGQQSGGSRRRQLHAAGLSLCDTAAVSKLYHYTSLLSCSQHCTCFDPYFELSSPPRRHHCVAVAPTLPPHHHRKRPKADSGGWDAVEATPAVANRWDATPGGALGGATPGPNSWDATPGAHLGGGSKWDATPGASLTGATPAPRRNRWDETPAAVSALWDACGGAICIRSSGVPVLVQHCCLHPALDIQSCLLFICRPALGWLVPSTPPAETCIGMHAVGLRSACAAAPLSVDVRLVSNDAN
jgi:hypothetical protein